MYAFPFEKKNMKLYITANNGINRIHSHIDTERDEMFDDSLIKIPDFSDVPTLKPVKYEQDSWQDGLLVRSPNWLGDAVMTFPALKQLKALLPETCGLFVACPKGMTELYESMDIVNDVIKLENPHAFPSHEEYRKISEMHAGAAILFNNSLRDAIALRKAGIKNLYGTAARFRSIIMKQTWQFPPRMDRQLNTPHQAMKYLAMAYALGAPEWDGVMPELNPLTGPEIFCDDTLKALKGQKILAIAPGAAYGLAKCWEGENFRKTAGYWIQNGGTAVALGGPAEAEPCAAAVEGLDKTKAFNLSGKTTLAALIYILKHSKACLANDSGVMHLAAACGIHGVAPFGSSRDSPTLR